MVWIDKVPIEGLFIRVGVRVIFLKIIASSRNKLEISLESPYFGHRTSFQKK